MLTRRECLESSLLALLGSLLAGERTEARPLEPARPGGSLPGPVKPARLKPGDTVGLVLPSFVQWDPVSIDILLDSLKALGLNARLGKHVYDRLGYFAGRDEDRAADLNAMFADPGVNAIHCIRGGWGAARLLPLLDWAAIAKHPKILIGYSDITALLLAIVAKTGLITFHGPLGASSWNAFNVEWMKRVVWNGEAVSFANLRQVDDALVQVKNRTRTLVPGKARGRLLGGNLSVLAALVGSGYLPDFRESILFLEDVEEAPYRLDRMLTQLKLAGILGQVKGVAWGTCEGCSPGEGFGSLTVPDVLEDHFKPLGVPVYSGAMIGHVDRQFTLPLGVQVELDADAGTITMLESAVT